MKLLSKLINSVFKSIQKIRVIAYSILSNNNNIKGKPLKKQPLLFLGSGRLEFGDKVNIGYYPSPMFFNTYAHIEARKKDSKIFIFGKMFPTQQYPYNIQEN